MMEYSPALRLSLWLKKYYLLLLGLFLSLHSLILIQYWHFDQAEDAFITFRVAKNWAAGLGPVFNPGERVEACTTPLWLGILAGLTKIGFPTEKIAPILAGFCLLLIMALLRKIDRSSFVVIGLLSLDLAILLLALSGMETLLFLFLLLAASWLLWQQRFLAAGGIFALVTMTRPDGLIFVFIAILLLALRIVMEKTRQWKPMLHFIVFFLLCYAPFFLIRSRYYGYPWPNTYYAKTVIPFRWNLFFGLVYLQEFIAKYWGLWLTIPLIAWDHWQAAKKLGRNHFPLVAAAITSGLTIGYTVYVGGDTSSTGIRFFGPLILLGYFMVQQMTDRRLKAIALGVIIFNLILSGAATYQAQSAWLVHALPGHYRIVGQAFKKRLPPNTRIALTAIGNVGYYSELPLIDMLGLADEEIAHRGVLTDRWASKGHVKTGYLIALERRPDAFWFQQIVRHGTDLNQLVFPPPDREFKKLLDNSIFQTNYTPQALPITAGFDTILFVRHDSPALKAFSH